MKLTTFFYTLIALILSTTALRAQDADSNRTQVLKIRKAENNCSLEKLSYSKFVIVMYTRNENGDSARTSNWSIEFRKLYTLRIPKDGPRGFDKFKWTSNQGIFRVTMYGLRMAGKCTGSYITGKIWEKGREYGSFVLVPKKEYDEEWAPDSGTDL